MSIEGIREIKEVVEVKEVSEESTGHSATPSTSENVRPSDQLAQDLVKELGEAIIRLEREKAEREARRGSTDVVLREVAEEIRIALKKLESGEQTPDTESNLNLP